MTVPSEFTIYSLIAENLADAVTDCTSGYCLYKPVTSSSVFFHAVSSTFSDTVGSTATICGAFAKSSTGLGSALNCFIAACFSASACPAALYASSVVSHIWWRSAIESLSSGKMFDSPWPLPK